MAKLYNYNLCFESNAVSVLWYSSEPKRVSKVKAKKEDLSYEKNVTDGSTKFL